MKVPFVDWGSEYRANKAEYDRVWERINDTGQLMLRDEVARFEKWLADMSGARFAVGVNSGSDALLLSLEAAGVKGGEVITVSHTFVATIQAIERAGAKPVFLDVGPDELMDTSRLEETITENTRAILPVHLTGKVCDMETIVGVAEEYGLKVIEDSAQAIGASTLKGDAACFSFYPFKILGCPGDGGAVITNDEDMYRTLLLLRNHGNVSQTGLETYGDKGKVRSGWNSRLDNIHAAFLNERTPRFTRLLERRKEIANMYYQGLSDLPIHLPTRQKGRVYQEFVVQEERRKELVEYLNNEEVEVLPNKGQIVNGIVPNHIIWEPNLWLENTHKFTMCNVRLPIWPTLADEQIRHVIKSVRGFYGK